MHKGKYNAWILAHSFPAKTFFPLLTFLACNSSSVSFFSALWSKDCSLNMLLSSGSYMVSQATLVGLTGDCYCCVSYTLITVVIFHAAVSRVKSKHVKSTVDAPNLENVHLLLDK